MSWLQAFEHAEKLWGESTSDFEVGCCVGGLEEVTVIKGTLDNIEPLSPELIEENKNEFEKWTSQEDDLITFLVSKHQMNWDLISQHFKNRNAKSIEKRWTTKLNPSVKRGKWSPEEDKIVIDLYKKYGGKWKLIANRLDGRLPDSVKNRFYGNLRQRIVHNETPKTANNEDSSGCDLEKVSLDLRNLDFERLSESEKRKKLQELHYQLTAIKATISKTKRQISNLN